MLAPLQRAGKRLSNEATQHQKAWIVDITQLSQLPLTVLVILGAYWVIQRLNDDHAKRLVALIAEFSGKFQAIIDRAAEEREESRQRWMERDRTLISTVVENQKAMFDNAQQTHNLRTTLTPLVLWWEREQAAAKRKQRSNDGNADAA